MGETMTKQWAMILAALDTASAEDIEGLGDAELRKLEAVLYHWQQIMQAEQRRRGGTLGAK